MRAVWGAPEGHSLVWKDLWNQNYQRENGEKHFFRVVFDTPASALCTGVPGCIEDRIKLFTLRWRGVHWRTVYLHDVARVVWRTDSEESVNFLFFLHDGGVIPLWMNGAGLWKYWIEERLGKPLSMAEELPQPQAPEPARDAVSDDRVSVSQPDDRVPGQDERHAQRPARPRTGDRESR